MEGLDPEEARAIIDPALKLMIEAVRRYDGYVVQSTGDGIFALFGAPVAHEDHPQRACHAALAMRDKLRRRGEELRIQGRPGVEIRIGINTGEVVMRTVQTGGRTEYSPVGHVINLASRMQSVAPSDAIVVTEDTQRLVEGYFEVRGLGPTEVKGVPGPINVFEVVATGASRGHFDVAAQRGLTPFVGREHELEQLWHALEQTRAGRGQIVAVMAEAGTGKSRLLHEFKATLPAVCKLLEAYSVSHGKASAWLPVLELLRRYFGIKDVNDAATRREKARTALTALDAALDDTLPYLFGLLGIVEGADPLAQMDPQIKRQRTLDAIKRIVLRESLNQPLVVIFEDLHWIDAQTQALLNLLADSVADSRVLLVVNYRPEYSDRWNGKTYYWQIELSSLGSVDGAAMLSSLLGDSVELNPLKRQIAERTGGNPFFIEEIVQALFDEGALVRNGAVKVTRSLSQLRLPPTVQGILASRIDRQPSEHKQLLQTLSVIGRESSFGLLTQVASHSDTQLEQMLADLRTAEFIYEQPITTGVEYVFKHALTQEVAYNSLLIERRKQIHEQAGQALESMFADQLDDHLSQLAHHYKYSANIDKAVEYLGRAGQQALQRFAYDNAISSLTSAVDLLQNLPEGAERVQRELRLQLALGQALMSVKGMAAPEVERAIVRAHELCELLRDPVQSFAVLFGLWTVHFIRGEFRTAYQHAEQIMLRAQRASDPSFFLFAHVALGSNSLNMGKLMPAREHLEAIISLYDPERDSVHASRLVVVDPKANCLGYLGMALWTLGFPDQALKRGREAVAFAQSLPHPHSLAATGSFLSTIYQYRGEAQAALETAECVAAESARHGFSLWCSLAKVQRGYAMVELALGQEEGIAGMLEGLGDYRAIGAGIGRPHFLSLLATAYERTGRFEDGLRTLREALAIVNEHGERQYQAELIRRIGELVLKQHDSNVTEAQSCFERAIEVAQKQSAKSLELRATMSLARLLLQQGRRDEARTMLACIYDWFTEGFDTADLKNAKALLKEFDR
jgi:class 3 adenylate cyclase/predicted ATPase